MIFVCLFLGDISVAPKLITLEKIIIAQMYGDHFAMKSMKTMTKPHLHPSP